MDSLRIRPGMTRMAVALFVLSLLAAFVAVPRVVRGEADASFDCGHLGSGELERPITHHLAVTELPSTLP